MKKQRLILRDDENRDIKGMRREIAAVKESLREVASEAREDRRNFYSALEELDVAGIKESLEEKTSEASDERQNISSILEELLSEIRQE